MRIDAGYVLETLAGLVRINSVNPAFSAGTTCEREIAAFVGSALSKLGMEVQLPEPQPGRLSVLGRLRGRGGGRSLLLYAHLDTVGVEGMKEPFSAEVRDGRLFGRGAYDMKGGLAACMAAVRAIAGAGIPLAGDLLLAAPADEEAASLGMIDLLESLSVRADGAIVTEPTELRVCVAHKGFSWIEVETLGRAAHGSRFEEGIDANLRMGRFLHGLEGLEKRLRSLPGHPLLGPPSLHAATLRGGTGASTYAASSRLEIERRTLPGETEEAVLREIQAIADRLAAEDPTFRAAVRPILTREPFEVSPEAPIARTVRAASARVLGREPAVVGEPYWMDAALLAAAGIETAVIGPAGAGAHAAEEWVDLESVVQLAEILARAAVEWCGEGKAL